MKKISIILMALVLCIAGADAKKPKKNNASSYELLIQWAEENKGAIEAAQQAAEQLQSQVAQQQTQKPQQEQTKATNIDPNDKVVTLVVSGTAPTEREATELALRSAIEQAFGVFVSANTQILNDELVKDEIATVSSGNIQEYKKIAANKLNNGNIEVTLKATVSIDKLVTYSQSHGSSCELAGQKFLLEQKIIELNRKNAETVLDHMLAQIEYYVDNTDCWQYKLDIGTPKLREDGDFDLPISIYASVVPNVEVNIKRMYLRTLNALRLTDAERKNLEERGMSLVGFEGKNDDCDYRNINVDADSYSGSYNKKVKEIEQKIRNQYFVVYDNMNKIHFLYTICNTIEYDGYHKKIDDYFENYEANKGTAGFSMQYRESNNILYNFKYPLYIEMMRFYDSWSLDDPYPKFRECESQGAVMKGLIYGIGYKIRFTRSDLEKLSEIKIESYYNSPMKAIYGDSYIKACKANNPALLKKQQ